MSARVALLPLTMTGLARLFGLVGLVGCAVNESAEIEQYKSIVNRGIVDGDIVSSESPLTVLDSMLMANLNQESLAIAGEEYLQALIDQRRAAAAFLPTITLAPRYAFTDQAVGSSGGFSDEISDGTLDTPLGLDMAVNPVRDMATLRQADADTEVQHGVLLDVQDSLLIDVARTHYEVIRAQRLAEVLENSLQVQQVRVDEARVRLDAGLVRPLDLSLTESQASQTAVDLIRARTAEQTARRVLAFLTAESTEHREIVDRLDVPETLPMLDELLAEAEANRADVQAAERAIIAAQHQVEAAYGQYFPTASLNLQWFLQRESNPSDLDWTGLIQLSLPLFSAGLIEADVRESLSILRQAKSNDSLTRRASHRDVQIAHDNFLASFDRARQLRTQVRSASEALEQSEGLYEVGLATNLERLAAQDRLLAAELELVNAELDSKVFYLDLQRTIGRLHEMIGLEREP
jgi:outer membrane protein TolC